MKIRPSAVAGDAYTGSPTLLARTTTCVGPAALHFEIDWNAVERDLRRFARKRGYPERPGANLMAYTNALTRTAHDKRTVDALLGRHEDACVRAYGGSAHHRYDEFKELLRLGGPRRTPDTSQA